MVDDETIELYFTHAACFEVYDAAYVASHLEPTPPSYPGLNASEEDKADYMERRAGRMEWEEGGGRLTFFCPAVVEQRYDGIRMAWFNRDVFLDLSHVHRGDYDQPVTDFTFERYPRKDKQPHVLVRKCEGFEQPRVLNITTSISTFAPEDQVAVLKHVKAIGEAYVAPHCNKSDRVVEMVSAVRETVRVLEEPW